MKNNSNLDYNLLSNFFSIPITAFNKPKKKRPTPNYADASGRVAYIEKEGRQWVGWFKDQQGMEYLTDTKAELMAEMGIKKV